MLAAIKFTINVVILAAILIWGIKTYQKLHLQAVEEQIVQPITTEQRVKILEDRAVREDEQKKAFSKRLDDNAQVLDKVERRGQQPNPLEARVKAIESKEDLFQCKTDPSVIARLNALEDRNKKADEEDAKMAKELNELLQKMKADWGEDGQKPLKAAPPKPQKDREVEFMYDEAEAKKLAQELGRPLLITFHQEEDICKKCKAVRANCYQSKRVRNELFTKFVCIWPPTGWSSLTSKYEVTGFPTVAVSTGESTWETFSPSDDPDRFLEQVRRFEK